MDTSYVFPISDIVAMADTTEFTIALSNLVFQRWHKLGFDALSTAEQVAFCVDSLEREVNNGGFYFFFANSAGDYSDDTLKALQIIGAWNMVALLEAAMALFPAPGPSAAPEERNIQLEQLSSKAREKLYQLDEHFYQYPDNLTVLLRKYVEQHQTEFHPPLP